MPYLNCPACRLTVYNPPAMAVPQDCPRCRARLAEPVASLFESDRPDGVSPGRLLESLRERAAARGSYSDGESPPHVAEQRPHAEGDAA
jgi:hypothetical protein